MSPLVRNSEHRFSHDRVQFALVSTCNRAVHTVILNIYLFALLIFIHVFA